MTVGKRTLIVVGFPQDLSPFHKRCGGKIKTLKSESVPVPSALVTRVRKPSSD